MSIVIELIFKSDYSLIVGKRRVRIAKLNVSIDNWILKNSFFGKAVKRYLLLKINQNKINCNYYKKLLTKNRAQIFFFRFKI